MTREIIVRSSSGTGDARASGDFTPRPYKWERHKVCYSNSDGSLEEIFVTNDRYEAHMFAAELRAKLELIDPPPERIE